MPLHFVFDGSGVHRFINPEIIDHASIFCHAGAFCPNVRAKLPHFERSRHIPVAVRAIGAAEVLGAVGLILPMALRIAPWLTPLAAAGLTVLMLGGAATHRRLAILQAPLYRRWCLRRYLRGLLGVVARRQANKWLAPLAC